MKGKVLVCILEDSLPCPPVRAQSAFNKVCGFSALGLEGSTLLRTLGWQEVGLRSQLVRVWILAQSLCDLRQVPYTL